MPPPPPPTRPDVYAQLIAALHPPPPAVPEIEILPSSFPPQLLQESAALGVPKALLAPLFLQARDVFLSHVSSRGLTSHRAALQATAVILLFDPNHLTAANFRKRHIQRSSGGPAEDDRGVVRDAGHLAQAVQHELKFLEGLLTSPLSKHAKSSTLWAQRLWIVQNFLRSAVQERATDGAVQMMDMTSGMRCFWDGELANVMKAGERHPRNYYAWQYARQLFSIIRSGCVKGRPGDRGLLRDSIGLVHGWCLMHPRDISGWAFQVFLLEQLRSEGRDEGDKGKKFEDEIGKSAFETREFARKYEWKGESVEWFLKAMKTLDINDPSTGLLPENLRSSREKRSL